MSSVAHISEAQNKHLNVSAIFNATKAGLVVVLKNSEREMRYEAPWWPTMADIGNDLKAFPDATAWVDANDRLTPLPQFLSLADFLAGKTRPPREPKPEPAPKP